MDAFGDPSLFEEFDKARDPSDRLLLGKYKDDFKEKPLSPYEVESTGEERENEEEELPRFQLGSSDEDSDEDTDPDSLGTDTYRRDPDQEYSVGNGIAGSGGNGSKNTKAKRRQKIASNHTGSLGDNTGSLSLAQRAQLEKLKHENCTLKKHSRLINPEIHCKDWKGEGPAFQILFMNHPVARKYHNEIEAFMAGLLWRERRSERQAELKYRPNHVCLSAKCNDIAEPEEVIWQETACTVIGCSQMYQNFVMDSLGMPLVDYTSPALTDGWNIPAYEQQFKEALPCEDSDDEDDLKPKKNKKPKNTCFNCGGDHTLRECKEPKDFRRINENRKHFQSNFTPQQSLSKSRYLAEDDPRFTKFKPGVISNELKEAMGLKSNQLPPFIYQMRMLGYPPGYLKAAEVESSGLAMFDKHGKEMSVEGDALEDGEVDTGLPPKMQYDVSKLIDIPGFNIALPPGIKDEAEKLGMPPMNPHHAKSVLSDHLASSQYRPGSKRKRGANSFQHGGKRNRKDEPEPEDMDLDESEEERKGSPVGALSAADASQPPWTGPSTSCWIPPPLNPSFPAYDLHVPYQFPLSPGECSPSPPLNYQMGDFDNFSGYFGDGTAQLWLPEACANPLLLPPPPPPASPPLPLESPPLPLEPPPPLPPEPPPCSPPLPNSPTEMLSSVPNSLLSQCLHDISSTLPVGSTSPPHSRSSSTLTNNTTRPSTQSCEEVPTPCSQTSLFPSSLPRAPDMPLSSPASPDSSLPFSTNLQSTACSPNQLSTIPIPPIPIPNTCSYPQSTIFSPSQLSKIPVPTVPNPTQSQWIMEAGGASPAHLRRHSRAGSNCTSRGTTPTLEDLEDQERLLRKQIMDAEGDSESDVVVLDSLESGDDSQTDSEFIPPLPVDSYSTPQRPPLPAGTPPPTPPTRGPSAHSTPLPSTPKDSNAVLLTPGSGSSISVALGTPLLKESVQKSDSLPEASKWAEGITQHIPYENLPDATGTFDKMRKVLGEIRSKKAKS